MKKLVFSLVALTLALTAIALCACTGDAIPLPEEVTLQKVLDEGGYELVWGDEFDDDSIDHTKWRVGYDSPARRAGWYVDTSDTVFEKDGASISMLFSSSSACFNVFSGSRLRNIPR